MFGQLPRVLKQQVRTKRDFEKKDLHGNARLAPQPGDNYGTAMFLRQQRKTDEDLKKKTGGVKEVLQGIAYHEFSVLTDRKIIRRKLRDRVEHGMEAARRDLEIKKEKLRCMLLEEESEYTKEYVDRAQRFDDKKLEEMKLKAEQIRNKLETERLKVVQEKRIQQVILRSEEFRKSRSKQTRYEVKNAQEYQMKEHEYMKEQEREEERMWVAVAKKTYEAFVEREIDEARRKFERDKSIAEVILMQKKALDDLNEGERQRITDEEAKMKDQIAKEIRDTEIAEHQNMLKAKRAVYNQLMDQIKKRQDHLKKMAEEEQTLEDAFCAVARAELQKELSKVQDLKETLKRESQLYRDNLEELRRRRVAEEAELDEVLQQEKDKVEAERKEKAMKLKAARQKLTYDTLRGRKEQLDYQFQMNEKLRKEEDEEIMLTELIRQQNQRLTDEHEFQLKQMRRKYAADLQAQVEYNNLLKLREREELRREYEDGLLAEQNYLRLTKELMSTAPSLDPHPFYRVLTATLNLDDQCPCPIPQGSGDQRR